MAVAETLRVLIVDDQPDLCKLVSIHLQSAGWATVVAHSCAEAFPIINDLSKPIDLSILDIRLPDGSGMDLIPLLQAREEYSDVVIISGFPDAYVILEALRFGVMDFLSKPISSSDLSLMLRRRHIKRRIRFGLLDKHLARIEEGYQAIKKELDEIRAFIEGMRYDSGRAVSRPV